MEVGKVTSFSFWWSSENVPQTVWEKQREHTAEMPRHPPWLKTVQLIGVLLLSSWHLCATSLSQPNLERWDQLVQMLHSWNLPAKKESSSIPGVYPRSGDCPQDLQPETKHGSQSELPGLRSWLGPATFKVVDVWTDEFCQVFHQWPSSVSVTTWIVNILRPTFW